VGFGYEAEERSIPVEAPGPPGLNKLKPWLVMTIEYLVSHATLRPTVY
jgi:hypothetical protein